MDGEKYTNLKIVHLKIKSVIIVEIRNMVFSYCRKEPRKKDCEIWKYG